MAKKTWSAKPIGKGTLKVPKGGAYNLSTGARTHPPRGSGGGGKKGGCAVIAFALAAAPVVAGWGIWEVFA